MSAKLMKGLQIHFLGKIYSLGKICLLGKNTKFEAFLLWNSDSPFICKHTGSTNMSLAGRTQNLKITTSSPLVFSLALHFIFLFCSGLESEPLRSGAARQKDSYQRQAKGSDPAGTGPTPCSGLRNPVDAHFSASERREN